MNCRLPICNYLTPKSGTLFLGRLDRKTRDADGNRSLNQFHGHDESLIAIHRGKNPLEPVESSSTNSDALPYVQERVRSYRDTALHDSLHTLDLIVGNRNANPARAYEIRDAVGTQHRNASVETLSNPHEDVLRK